MSKLHLDKADEPRYQRALSLAAEGRDVEAAVIVEEIAGRNPSAGLHGFAGGLFWRAGENLRAVTCFQEATKIKPRSELAATGLFHALLDMGEKDAARAELRRFIEITGSSEFKSMLDELERSPPDR